MVLNYNFSIIACDAWRARSCATLYILTGAQHTLRAGIVRDDRELFHQIIVSIQFKVIAHKSKCYSKLNGAIHVNQVNRTTTYCPADFKLIIIVLKIRHLSMKILLFKWKCTLYK